MVMVTIKGKEFYLDSFLKQKLDNLKRIVFQKNWDGLIIIDGLERIGKSTLGLTCAWYLSDGNFTVFNIGKDTADIVNKIEIINDKSIILVDESSLVFNSKDAMRKEQKKLIKILNVCGQKNLIFILILPSIFDLNKSIAIRRSKFLLHCYADNELRRGRFAYFGEDAKKVLYAHGKKNYDSYEYPKRSINELGKFTDFNPLGQEYLDTKRETLYKALHEDDRVVSLKVKMERMTDVVKNIEAYKFPFKFTQEQKSQMLGITRKTYYNYLKLVQNGGVSVE